MAAQANREVFELALAAFNRRDVDEILTYLDPEIEWHPVLEVLLGGTQAVYRGHDGIREMFDQISEVLGEIRAEISEVVRDSGDLIVAEGKLHAIGKLSGAVTEAPLGFFARFRQGKVLEVRSYRSAQEALEAAG